MENLSMSYGAEEVFRGLTAHISRGDKIGLIGENGSGKTTLLRLIADLESPSGGTVERLRGIRVGYLPQEPELEGESSVFREVLKAFGHLQALEAELRSLEQEMSDTRRIDAVLRRYHNLLQRYESQGGYTYRSDTRSVLAGLGLGPGEWRRPVSTLSGGEKARASLAKVVLEDPDLLLLDEPTNHLDFAALEWLGGYLARWRGSLVVSTHDRLLLTGLPRQIWELSSGKLRTYSGGYRDYLKVREQQEETQLRKYGEQQGYIQRTEEFIRRYRAGQRHRQAKDREKKLERLERVDAPQATRTIRFTFDSGMRCPERAVATRDLVVGFEGGSDDGPTVLFRCPDLELTRGERVALVGPNGSGKSSFLRVIMGEFQPLMGNVTLGQNVEVGYLPQDREESLDGQMTVLGALLAGKEQAPREARDFLGRFLFSRDSVFKRLSELSGGELSRLVLARLAQVRGNLLLLDEPTNHLDIGSREVLQRALEEYEGTVLMVSHDRYLIDALATSVWEIRDGQLHAYRGNYAYYQRRRQQGEAAPVKSTEGDADGPSPRPAPRRKPPARKAEEPGPDPRAAEAELMEQLIGLEEEIARTEAELEEASYAQDHQRIARLNSDYKLRLKALREKLARWTRTEDVAP